MVHGRFILERLRESELGRKTENGERRVGKEKQGSYGGVLRGCEKRIEEVCRES